MKARNILISVFAVAALGSCDFLDEYNPNSVTTGNFYKTESDVETSVNGIYSALTQSYISLTTTTSRMFEPTPQSSRTPVP